jgi:hypothetical protein
VDEETFLERLAKFKAMPDRVSDVRDFQLVKTRPYPGELKGKAFAALYAQANDEQRRRLSFPYFQEAAHTAGTDNHHGVGSTRDWLAYFHSSAIFKEQVEPRLPGTGK